MTSQNAVLRDQRIDLLRGIAVLIIFSERLVDNAGHGQPRWMGDLYRRHLRLGDSLAKTSVT